MKQKPISVISFKFDKVSTRALEERIEELINNGEAKSQRKAIEILLKKFIYLKIKKEVPKKTYHKRFVFRCDYELHKKATKECERIGITLTEALRRIVSDD